MAVPNLPPLMSGLPVCWWRAASRSDVLFWAGAPAQTAPLKLSRLVNWLLSSSDYFIMACLPADRSRHTIDFSSATRCTARARLHLTHIKLSPTHHATHTLLLIMRLFRPRRFALKSRWQGGAWDHVVYCHAHSCSLRCSGGDGDALSQKL